MPWKNLVTALYDFAKWVLRICLAPFIGVLEAVAKACQKLADELSKV